MDRQTLYTLKHPGWFICSVFAILNLSLYKCCVLQFCREPFARTIGGEQLGNNTCQQGPPDPTEASTEEPEIANQRTTQPTNN
jgi:hypothetical protein